LHNLLSFIILKTGALRTIIFFVAAQLFFFVSYAQQNSAAQSGEMKQAIAELKKEISQLEEEIKNAGNDDPEGLASMKAQLSTMKTLLATLNPSKPSQVKQVVAPAKQKTVLPASPVLTVHLKQPVITPAPSQATDRLFWYRGKKINDSTMITPSGTLIQYSDKRDLIIVQPDGKKDRYNKVVKEVEKGSQRNTELTSLFDRMQNGFIYYPFLTSSLAAYDDLTRRYTEAVKNVVSFELPRPHIAGGVKNPGTITTGKGGFAIKETEATSAEESILAWVEAQLKEAAAKLGALPSPEMFDAPPLHDLGRCASCDTASLRRQAAADRRWIQSYEDKERAIMQQVISAYREYSLQPDQSASDGVYEKFISVFNGLMERMSQKDKILVNRYGQNLQALPIIIQTVLSHERQRQLLGYENGGSSEVFALAVSMMNLYSKYYDEQVAAKNHDFVLNIPFHLGVFRQCALLGVEDKSVPGIGEFLEKTRAYNRFALTMDLDFAWQRTADGELELRATGKMAMPEKLYVTLIPDSCSFRLMAYKTDLSDKSFEDITLPFKVSGGVKTMRDQNGKMKDFPYSGPSEYAFRFPDSRIDFCPGTPDTIFLALITGDKSVAARAEVDIQNTRNAYTVDMLGYAAQVMLNENTDALIEGTLEGGNKILQQISAFTQQAPPSNTLEKMKMQYEGYMQMDNLRKNLESSYATAKAKIVFNTNNRSTVLVDTHKDLKRKMEDDVEVTRGLFHLRIAHEPKQ